MSLLRALGLPFQMASLLFVALVAVLNLFIGGAPDIRPMRLLPLYLLLSWLNKYAVALLQLAANGSRHAPVASVEMLGPFGDPRVLIHPTLAAAVFLALALTSSPWVDAAAILVGLLIPASLAALAAAPHALDTVNPVVLWRLISGLGVWYLVLLLAAAACTGALWLLYDAPGPALVRFAISELLVLSLYAFIGGALHHRRLELAFEPINSPEREAERLHKEHERDLQRVADEFYGAIRARDLRIATATLASFLGGAHGTHLALDVERLIGQAVLWPEKKGLLAMLRIVITHALTTRQTGLALLALEAGLKHISEFSLEGVSETEQLVLYAKQGGRRRLAATLLDNYARNVSGGTLPEPLRSLRADLPA